MGLNEDFVKRARDRREELGVSLRDLADRMQQLGHQWHHTTVVRTELGKRPIRLDEAAAVAELLAIPVVTGPVSEGQYARALKRIADLMEQLEAAESEIEAAESDRRVLWSGMAALVDKHREAT